MTPRLINIVGAALVVSLAPFARATAQDAQLMPSGIKIATTSVGPTLVDSAGMTLYTWGNDTTAGKSACNGGCATNWPPLMATRRQELGAASDAKPVGDWTVVTRDDGSKQWAYKGKPLYRYRMDAKGGDVVGNGRGAWKVAVP